MKSLPDKTTAEEVWLANIANNQLEWLCWFAFRIVPIGDFAFKCADRAVRTYAPIALDIAGHTEEAEQLRNLEPIADASSATAACALIDPEACRTTAYEAAEAIQDPDAKVPYKLLIVHTQLYMRLQAPRVPLAT